MYLCLFRHPCYVKWARHYTIKSRRYEKNMSFLLIPNSPKVCTKKSEAIGPGSFNMLTVCNQIKIIAILAWASWGAWSRCSASCCGGEQSRSRSCRSCGDSSSGCIGSSMQTQECNTFQCTPGELQILLYQNHNCLSFQSLPIS